MSEKQQHGHTTQEEEGLYAGKPLVEKVFLWTICSSIRMVLVFSYAGASVFPGGPPAFGPDAPNFAKLLSPRVSHKEVFDGEQ